MNLDSAYTLIGIVGGFCVLLGGWWRWWRPRYRQARRTLQAVTDTLVGRDSIVDPASGKELSPAQPGLGVRMATMESAIAALANANATLANHEQRIHMLEQGQIERIVTKAESAQMWRAVADGDLLDIPDASENGDTDEVHP